VTFVFTDIEGSTRLLRRLGDRYAAVLDRHRALLRRSWSAYGGTEVSTEGDGCFVAFPSAAAAVTACAEAQRLLHEESWEGGEPVLVRMGIHCGLASPRGGDYVALAVHQAARVASAARGGQVLVSDDAAIEAGVLPDLTLEPAGRYRLRDFDAPVVLHRLRGPGLPEHPGAVRALPAEGHNLVRPPTAFIGRGADVALVREHLTEGCLVTLVGPGGIGKTRLATEVGIRVAAAWTDGVWMVDLTAAEDDPELIAEAVADTLGVPPSPSGHRWSEVLAHLAQRHVLLVLDNCEHVLAPCAALVADLLAGCPRLGVLATSRERLEVVGECLVRLAPLPGGDDEASAGRSPAVQLFLDRVRRMRPDLPVDDVTVATAATICRRLDGLPLAIEIAAAQARHLSLPELLAGLEQRALHLRVADRAIPLRHRTLQDVLDWSYRLLSPAEKDALRHLSVFGGSFSLDAAVVALGDETDGPELVWSLVDKSLAVADLTANQTRYRLLETVRTYAASLAGSSEDDALAVARLGQWYRRCVGAQQPNGRAWIGEVGVELDNLRAVTGALARRDQPLAQELAWTIGRYHDTVQRFRSGLAELGRLEIELRAPTPARVAVLTLLADLHLRVGEVAEAQGLVDEAARLRGEVGAAPWDDAGVERTRGEIARRSGDLAGAVAIADETLARELSHRGRGRMANLRGISLLALGDLEGAEASFLEELRAYERLGLEAAMASANGNVAEVALQRGSYDVAAAHQRRCLDLAMHTGQPVMVAFSLMVAARLAGIRGRWTSATSLQGAAEAILSTTGIALYESDRTAAEELLTEARAQLPREVYAEAERQGRSLPLADAAAAADVVLGSVAGPGPAVQDLAPATRGASP
jgi:predicted ATPase/class 3 adenylate cyclase